MEHGEAINPAIMKAAEELSIYASEPRYPGELNITENDAKAAIQQAQAIIDWAKGLIKSK